MKGDLRKKDTSETCYQSRYMGLVWTLTQTDLNKLGGHWGKVNTQWIFDDKKKLLLIVFRCENGTVVIF